MDYKLYIETALDPDDIANARDLLQRARRESFAVTIMDDMHRPYNGSLLRITVCLLTLYMLLIIYYYIRYYMRSSVFDNNSIKFGRTLAVFHGNMPHWTCNTIMATDGSAPTRRRGICGHSDVSYFLHIYVTSITRVKRLS